MLSNASRQASTALLILFVLGCGATACQPASSIVAPPAFTAVPTGVPAERPASTSTSPATATVTPKPTSTPTRLPTTRPTQAITPTPSPHPALFQLAPEPYGEVRWEGNSEIAVRQDWGNHKDECAGDLWVTYALTGTSSHITKTTCLAIGCTGPCQPSTPIPGMAQIGELTDGPPTVLYSPDGSKALIVAQTQTPTAAIDLHKYPPPSPDWSYQQAWLINSDGSGLRPLFYSTFDYQLEWAADSRHVVASGDCYYFDYEPDLLVVDTRTTSLYKISDKYYGWCEAGGAPFQVSPDSRRLIYAGDVISIHGSRLISVCAESERARSYAWSPDSRYAYVDCANPPEGPGVLRKYDTQAGEKQDLTNPDRVTFKAIQMAISPDQKRVAFIWGDSPYFNGEEYGVWILDLTRLDE